MSTITLSPTPLGPRRQERTTPLGPRPQAERATPQAERMVVRPEGGVRLTRRGRVVMLLACLAVVSAVAFFLGASSVATQQPGAEAPAEVVTVGTGETLWELAAERTEPGGDVRDMMVRIERLNALETTALDAGQRLLVPAGSAAGE